MTKKDYAAIAETIRAERFMDELEFAGTLHELTRKAVEQATERVAYALARTFSEDNPRFNPTKFVAACGIKE